VRAALEGQIILTNTVHRLTTLPLALPIAPAARRRAT
jgi:hypothetical protein